MAGMQQQNESILVLLIGITVFYKNRQRCLIAIAYLFIPVQFSNKQRQVQLDVTSVLFFVGGVVYV
jgi:hypothetical protein